MVFETSVTIINPDAVVGVAGNHIARGGTAPPMMFDEAPLMEMPLHAVGQRVGAGGGKADEIALNQIPAGAAGQKNSIAAGCRKSRCWCR